MSSRAYEIWISWYDYLVWLTWPHEVCRSADPVGPPADQPRTLRIG